MITGPEDGVPKSVKIFTNQFKTMDFDAAERMQAVQELE